MYFIILDDKQPQYMKISVHQNVGLYNISSIVLYSLSKKKNVPKHKFKLK